MRIFGQQADISRLQLLQNSVFVCSKLLPKESVLFGSVPWKLWILWLSSFYAAESSIYSCCKVVIAVQSTFSGLWDHSNEWAIKTRKYILTLVFPPWIFISQPTFWNNHLADIHMRIHNLVIVVYILQNHHWQRTLTVFLLLKTTTCIWGNPVSLSSWITYHSKHIVLNNVFLFFYIYL